MASSLWVATDRRHTHDWLSDTLLGGIQLPPGAESYNVIQSHQLAEETKPRIGALFHVPDTKQQRSESEGIRVTELVFYASQRNFRGPCRLPTLPTSSPRPDIHDGEQYKGGVLQHDTGKASVHALPLSSELLYKSSLYPSVSVPQGEARFLASVEDAQTPYLPLQKRDRLGLMFEEATDRGKKARRRGGQSISLVASKSSGAPNPPHVRALGDKAIRNEEDQHKEDTLDLTMGPKAVVLPMDHKNGFSKPASTRDKVPPLLRPTVSSENVDSLGVFQDKTFEARNKQSVSRIVMAGLRMHGLQQEKRVTALHKAGSGESKPSSLPEQEDGREDTENSEFKSVYHQTYKATLFAFVSQ